MSFSLLPLPGGNPGAMDATGGGPDSDRLIRRLGAIEVNGRRVNEAIDRGQSGSESRLVAFVCECGHVGCNVTVGLAIPEYESVRSAFDRFLVVPGHEIAMVDEVVERHGDYLVVVKREGEAREVAAATDPRSE